MNRRTIRLFTDGLISLVIAGLCGMFISVSFGSWEYLLAFGLIPVIWMSLRYGSANGIINGALVGLVVGYYKIYVHPASELGNVNGVVYLIIAYVLAYALAGGLAGLFAKYTQKTLNNARYKSSYLNITTASLLANVVYYLVHYWLAPLVLNMPNAPGLFAWQMWMHIIIMFLVSAILLCTLAKSNKKLFIPRGTKFLSRRETSSLLND